MTADPAGADPADGDGRSRRDLAVARSLDSARNRAEGRFERFIGAARELLVSGSGRDFTVQEVVERSGQSLRSFYQYFGGKHELLLALFEDAISGTTDSLERGLDPADDPLRRLHDFVVSYYEVCGAGPTGPRSRPVTPALMAEFAQELLTRHPAEAARAFRPLVALARRLIDDAQRAGALRPGLSPDRVAGVLLETVMFHTFAGTIAGLGGPATSGETAEELWDLVLHGIAGPGGGTRSKG